MKQFIIIIAMLYSIGSTAQETIYPSNPQSQTIVISNAVIHIGNGQVINNASIEFSKGKITQVGTDITLASETKMINARGKHVYPGLILSATNLGLVEVPSVRATNDVAEITIVCDCGLEG